MILTYNETVTMITEICCNCGVAFGMPSDLRKVLKADTNKYFYCPNGHAQHYTKSTESILKDKIESERQKHQEELERMQNRLLDELNAKNKLEKQLKRVRQGTCPCCNRSFSNLERHIKTKHPDVAPTKPLNPIHTKLNNKTKAIKL